MKSSIPLDDEHAGIRDLKHRWDEEDKTRDELERQAQRAFLEQEANELFAPLENYLTRLDKVLHQANAAVARSSIWRFFWGAVSINFEKRWQSLQADTGLYAVRS